MTQLLTQFLQWLETVLPGWVFFFSTGYSLGAKGKNALQKENINLTLENKHLASEAEVEKVFSGMSGSDIAGAIIDREREKSTK